MKRKFILHPFLFALYSVLGVYSRNAAEVPVQWVIRPTLVLLALTGILFFILRKALNDSEYAGLISTLSIFWLFFGHFHRVLSEKSVFWSTAPGIWLSFTLWTIPLASLGSKWIWKRITNHKFVTLFLNTTSIFVLLLPLFSTSSALVQSIWQKRIFETRRSIDSSISLLTGSPQPDIYLIILDAYGREDFLREIYGFDNSEFIEYLNLKGFYVASQSSPNYPQTALSLSSMLNMRYLDDLTDDFRDTNARGPAIELMQHSDVRRYLKDVGYQFIALPSATLFTQMRDADIYFKMTLGDLNEFEGLLISSTIAGLVIDYWDLDIPVPSYDLHRRYILFTLDTLETIPEIGASKYVFAHIMAPHPPFVLDAQGNPVQPERPYNMGDATGFMGTSKEYVEGYVNEIQFLNQRLMEVIDIVLVKSEQPPVIIIMGDHGPGNYFNIVELKNNCFLERYSILNAFYFPDGDYSGLYETITPVNSFRVVFNQYFGTDLELLEDRNYYATWMDPYIYQDISEQAQNCDEIIGD